VTDTSTNIGLIAGQGKLPVITAHGMRAAGRRVCCVGLRDQFVDELREHCDELTEAGILQLGRWIRILRAAGVREAVMVGRVDKKRMHDPLRMVRQLPDWRAVNIWYRRLRHDRRTPAMLGAVADELAQHGITLIDSTKYIPDHLATPGTMGRVSPSAMARADIEFGWALMQQVAELNIGQSIAVRERDVIAVEAVEGTDALIARTATLCRARGWSLLKTSSGGHDQRADVPTIGIATVRNVAGAGGRCIAMGAGRVILIDKPEVIAVADRVGVALVGV